MPPSAGLSPSIRPAPDPTFGTGTQTGTGSTLPALPTLPRTVQTPESDPGGMVRSGGAEGIRTHLPRVGAPEPGAPISRALPSKTALLVPYGETAPGGEQIDGTRLVNPGHPDYDDARTTALFFHEQFGHEVPYAGHLEPGTFYPQAPLGTQPNHMPKPTPGGV